MPWEEGLIKQKSSLGKFCVRCLSALGNTAAPRLPSLRLSLPKGPPKWQDKNKPGQTAAWQLLPFSRAILGVNGTRVGEGVSWQANGKRAPGDVPDTSEAFCRGLGGGLDGRRRRSPRAGPGLGLRTGPRKFGRTMFLVLNKKRADVVCWPTCPGSEQTMDHGVWCDLECCAV